jgi:hypothetical protein
MSWIKGRIWIPGKRMLSSVSRGPSVSLNFGVFFFYEKTNGGSYTGAAECQDPDFLIGPRNKKTRKKRPNIKILHPPVQIASLHFR